MDDNAKSSIDEHKKEIGQLKERLDQLNVQKEKFFSDKEKVSEQIRALISEIQKDKKSRNELTDSVKASKVERDKLNKEIQEKAKTIKGAPKHMPRGVNPKALKVQIDALEMKIETGAISFEAEKKIMKTIKELKKEYDAIKEQYAGAEEAMGASKEIRALKKQADEYHKVVQEKAKTSQETHEKIIAKSKEVDVFRVNEKELRDKFLEKKKEFTQSNDRLKFLLGEVGEQVKERKDTQQRKKNNYYRDLLSEKRQLVEEKIAKGEKLTNEDILVLQGAE